MRSTCPANLTQPIVQVMKLFLKGIITCYKQNYLPQLEKQMIPASGTRSQNTVQYSGN
jgi:hypothetical protein